MSRYTIPNITSLWLRSFHYLLKVPVKTYSLTVNKITTKNYKLYFTIYNNIISHWWLHLYEKIMFTDSLMIITFYYLQSPMASGLTFSCISSNLTNVFDVCIFVYCVFCISNHMTYNQWLFFVKKKSV